MKTTFSFLFVAVLSVATMYAQNSKRVLYLIDGNDVENCCGSQLEGITKISNAVSDSCAVNESHDIRTLSAEMLLSKEIDIVYVVDDKIVTYSKVKKMSPSKIASITVITNKKDPNFIKYAKKAMEKGKPEPQSIILIEDARVDIGYGTERKYKLTTAVSQVKVDKNDVGGYSNMYDYLRGKVPGVNVIGSGRSASIQIRGINSLYCSTEPLILVDGVEISDLNMINPNDVKSVSVLKDSSASIYGSKGANGVILITMNR